MCVLLDMYEERGEARGIHEINTLNLRLLDDKPFGRHAACHGRY